MLQSEDAQYKTLSLTKKKKNSVRQIEWIKWMKSLAVMKTDLDIVERR